LGCQEGQRPERLVLAGVVEPPHDVAIEGDHRAMVVCVGTGEP